MDFDVDLVRDELCTVAVVRGELDIVSRAPFEERAKGALDAGKPVVLDLRQVTFCDSTGLNAIVSVNRSAVAAGVPLAVVAVPPRIRKIFQITAVDRYIPVHETMAEALGTFPSTTP